jgi:hypothetical protein
MLEKLGAMDTTIKQLSGKVALLEGEKARDREEVSSLKSELRTVHQRSVPTFRSNLRFNPRCIIVFVSPAVSDCSFVPAGSCRDSCRDLRTIISDVAEDTDLSNNALAVCSVVMVMLRKITQITDLQNGEWTSGPSGRWKCGSRG